MKFVVTGGAGFIGSNIAQRLIADGHEVAILDDLSLGRKMDIPNTIFSRGDVRDGAIVDALCKDADGVFHEAAKSSSPMFLPDPKEGIEINTMGFINVAEAARKYDFPIVYASTSSLYSQCPPPHREDQRVMPRTFYELAAYSREAAARLYSEAYGLRMVGLRYFSVYGPNEDHKGQYANNITQFIWSLVERKSPVIYGDGTQSRDFIYVEDVVEANVLAMKANLKGEIINAGTGISTSFNDMCAVLKKEMKSTLSPTYVPNPIKNYVAHTQADTSKAKRLIGFTAKVSLEDGVRRTLEYY